MNSLTREAFIARYYPDGDTSAVVAWILDDDGLTVDAALNLETAQNMALSSGYAVEAVRDDGRMSRDEIQALCDYERKLHRDCFGIEPFAA